jgi:hypothetical protein
MLEEKMQLWMRNGALPGWLILSMAKWSSTARVSLWRRWNGRTKLPLPFQLKGSSLIAVLSGRHHWLPCRPPG